MKAIEFLLSGAVVLLGVSLGPLASAQEVEPIASCEAPLMTVQPPESWQSLSEDVRLQTLFYMIGSNGLPDKDRADMFRKGEIVLGIPGSSGASTLRLEYRRNSFQSPVRFRLARIFLVTYNNSAELSLSKEPFNGDGKLNSIDFKSPEVAAEYFDILFPTVIEGKELATLEGAAGWSDKLTQSELREWSKERPQWMRVVGNKRRFVRWAAGRIQRFAFAGVLGVTLSAALVPSGSGLRFPHSSLLGRFFAQSSESDPKQMQHGIDVLLANPQIAASEQAWLRDQVEHSKHHINEEMSFSQSDVKVISDARPGDAWVFVPSTGKVFFATLAVESEGSSARLKVQAVLEIPKKHMPLTYETILRKFVNEFIPASVVGVGH